MEETPILWDDLKKYHLNPPKTWSELKRTKLTQMMYNLHLKIIPSKEENILKNYFNNNQEFCIAQNKFPYNVEKNIQHYIFLIRSPNFTQKQVTEKIQEWLKTHPEFESTYVCYKTLPHIRSQFPLEHYQLFFKLK